MPNGNRDRVEGCGAPRPTVPTAAVCFPADTSIYATGQNSAQSAFDLDRDAIRDAVVLRLVRQHGLTADAAAVVAILAGLGPSDGGGR